MYKGSHNQDKVRNGREEGKMEDKSGIQNKHHENFLFLDMIRVTTLDAPVDAGLKKFISHDRTDI